MNVREYSIISGILQRAYSADRFLWIGIEHACRAVDLRDDLIGDDHGDAAMISLFRRKVYYSSANR